MVQGVFNFNLSAVWDRVNITIWNGTTMENANSKYIILLNALFTRVIYHAHMEQKSKIAATEVMVINRL